jgi:DNA adenine methylase
LSKPAFKAAGGKTKLVPTILRLIPAFTGRYHEPFVGGGAVFLAIHAERVSGAARIFGRRGAGAWAVLNDTNPELMNAYAVIKSDKSSELVKKLQAIKHSKETYYKIREKEEEGALARAVRFGYLNKTCFNGLYRVNGSGKFNVPIGSYKNPTIVEPEVISVWHRALAHVDLYSEDFMYRLAEVKSGDFVYADPPYLPQSETANFTSYTSGKFDSKDHERLARALEMVHERGGKFLCSQGDSDVVRSLYKSFVIEPVKVRHSVGASAKSRSNVGELLIRNYEMDGSVAKWPDRSKCESDVHGPGMCNCKFPSVNGVTGAVAAASV